MPYSLPFFDDVVNYLIKHIMVETCLDIGAGAGKYGKMVRQFHPGSRLTAIEIDPTYIEQFNLKDIYDNVLCQDATQLIEVLTENYDLVILGDCLEHLRKSQGIDLLSYLLYHSRYLLIIYPEGLIQGSWQGHPQEAHISAWFPSDFINYDHLLMKRMHTVLVAVNGFLLRRVDLSVQEVLSLYINQNTEANHDESI